MNVDTATCGKCGAAPDGRDRDRSRRDLERHGGKPVAWYCPRCAPDLELAPSGLAWSVLDVGGCSPPQDHA